MLSILQTNSLSHSPASMSLNMCVAELQPYLHPALSAVPSTDMAYFLHLPCGFARECPFAHCRINNCVFQSANQYNLTTQFACCHAAMPALCRSLAVKRRNALLLYEYSRNAAGLPIPGTQRHFKLSANPRQIGQESVGLGVYLTSVIMYMGILSLLALLMIYLTVDNSQQNGYTQTYTSFVNNVSCLD